MSARFQFCAPIHAPHSVFRYPLALALTVAFGLALAPLSPSQAGEPGTTLGTPTIVPGGGVITCAEFQLTFTIGEAASGTASAGDWRMVTGFPATLPDPPPLPDSIFEDGFEAVAKTTTVAKGACVP